MHLIGLAGLSTLTVYVQQYTTNTAIPLLKAPK